MRFWVIRVGWFHTRADVFVPSDESGTWSLAPVYSCLAALDDGRLFVFDTGCSEALARDPRSILGDFATILEPRIAPEDHIAAQIRALGFRPEDVAEVALSHLHFDHAGGAGAFPHAQFVVQRREWEARQAADVDDHYPDPASRLDPSRLRLLDGDTEWAPGLTLLATPGHTPGHQSLAVHLPGVRLLFTADAVYRASLFDPEHIGAAADPDAARKSVARLKALAGEGYRPIFSHDPDQWREDWLRLAPAHFG